MKSFFSYTGEPLESIVIMQIGRTLETINEFKCLTYFSQTQMEWNNFQAQLDLIEIQIDQYALIRSMPYFNLFYIAIHSSNHLADFDLDTEFKVIRYNKLITIKYSEQRIKRLGHDYDTDCYSYELNNNFGYYRMRSDCPNDCYQDKLRQLCKVEIGLFMSKFLIRKDYLSNENNRIISCSDPVYNQISFTIKKDCENLCKIECNFKYYTNEIETSELDFRNTIKIIHSGYPDILVEHIPEMNLIGFFCNFGGLLGMWLGLSIFEIFQYIFHLLHKIMNKNYINGIISNLIRQVQIQLILLITDRMMSGSSWLKYIIKRIKLFFIEKLGFSIFKQFERKLKSNAMKITQIIILIVSVYGLIYQVKIIYDQYMSGKTIISLEIGGHPGETLPAITLCYVELYSMERAGKFNYQEGFNGKNLIYQDILRKDFKKAKQLYEVSFRNLTYQKFKNNSLNINDVIEKMTIKFNI